MFPLQAGLGQPVVSFHANLFEQVKSRLAISVAYTAPPATSAWLSTNTFVRPIDLTEEQLLLLGTLNSACKYIFSGSAPEAHSRHSCIVLSVPEPTTELTSTVAKTEQRVRADRQQEHNKPSSLQRDKHILSTFQET